MTPAEPAHSTDRAGATLSTHGGENTGLYAAGQCSVTVLQVSRHVPRQRIPSVSTSITASERWGPLGRVIVGSFPGQRFAPFQKLFFAYQSHSIIIFSVHTYIGMCTRMCAHTHTCLSQRFGPVLKCLLMKARGKIMTADQVTSAFRHI